MMEPSFIITADGSHSLYLKDLDQHYHSIHGAIQEGLHVFIEAGLKYITRQNKSSIHILEIGFGTGLNAFLTFIVAEKLNLEINYSSLEAYPLGKEVISKLNYVECLKEENRRGVFNLIHEVPWEQETVVSKSFTLHKIKNTLQEIVFENKYDLIYFDAFGPRVQPEMWTEENFIKLFSALNAGGSLVTYCAKGEVKRTLKKVGFLVEALPGPPGKREMIRGNKVINKNGNQ